MRTSLSHIMETNGAGWSANVESDVRVIKDIERKAQVLQGKLWDLEVRWEKRIEKLSRRECVDTDSFHVDVDFQDILC